MNKDSNQIFTDNFYKAEKLYKEKKFLQSLKKYKELLTLNPKHISVLNNIGLNYAMNNLELRKFPDIK